MIKQKSFEVLSTEKIIIQNSLIPNLDFDQQKLEQVWRNECEKKNNKLFNGKVLTYIDSLKKDNEFIIKGGFVDYKIVLSARKEPSLGLKIKQIGVSGITIVEDKDEYYVLFSTRSSQTTEYPGFIELVPSGNIDESTIKTDGTIDYYSKLIDEFTEETGLEQDSIHKVSSLCFVMDKINQVYDVCCMIKIINSKENIVKNFGRVSEYAKPELISTSSLSKYIQKNYERIIPTSLAILSCFNKNSNLIT